MGGTGVGLSEQINTWELIVSGLHVSQRAHLVALLGYYYEVWRTECYNGLGTGTSKFGFVGPFPAKTRQEFGILVTGTSLHGTEFSRYYQLPPLLGG